MYINLRRIFIRTWIYVYYLYTKILCVHWSLREVNFSSGFCKINKTKRFPIRHKILTNKEKSLLNETVCNN